MQQPGEKAPGPPAPPSAETVVVMGGGIAGLGIALALRGSGRKVVIVERDAPPPEIEPASAFDGWKRPGVVQFRHPHIFLGRLQRLLRERYPDLLEELERAGFWELPASAYGIFREAYEPAPEDADLTQLCGRRATFEYVLQRYVRALPHVQMIHGATVEGISLVPEGRRLRARAIEVKRGGTRESIQGDVFVDCLGRRSPVFEWLRAAGRSTHGQAQEAQVMYFSRHYRLREGAKPQFDEQSGDMDFLRFAIVYGEDRHFAIGFSCAENDVELMQSVKRAEGFERLCQLVPQVKEWVVNADPLTPVMGAGDIRNRWTSWIDRDGPLALGLLHAGDSAHETNPIYGRGCSAAFVEAHLVAEALLASDDPIERARFFAARVRAELRPYYRLALSTDRMFQARSRAAQGLPVALSEHLAARAYVTLAVPAAFEDHQIARDLLGIMHMRTPFSLSHAIKFTARLLYVAVRRLLRRTKRAYTAMPARNQVMVSLREHSEKTVTSSAT